MIMITTAVVSETSTKDGLKDSQGNIIFSKALH